MLIIENKDLAYLGICYIQYVYYLYLLDSVHRDRICVTKTRRFSIMHTNHTTTP